MSYDTTLHKDRTATIWNVYTQSFVRLDAKSARESQAISGLDRDERSRVIAHTLGISTRWQTVMTTGYTRPATAHDGAAAGGVILVQQRRDGDRFLQRRLASNGRFQAVGETCEITIDELHRVS